MRLVTRRLVLRRFQDSDAEALAAYRSDPEVARYQGWDPPLPVRRAVEFVRELADLDPAAPGWFQYAVELRGELIGDIGVNLHENLQQAEIGYTFARAHQGRGYATEAVGRVLEHLFAERGLHRVAAECDARNERSARLLERLGFRLEGHRVASTLHRGEWTDDLLFGLLASEWRAGR
ncbi:GNAT family N-acetyltransferase [Saccharothrix coeruleofusca]|uniref:N-acetyltransferase n=1 Tax=Saccharothrix coeruleofusca TaxID=33919 RepID=A0A918ALI4_9PSEU|nr:GNAT family protein [Saccharothrix coeruleofusca]MBP2334209.1 aminoglycoside 6'-N-acetyltransferase [Saccharothrix coeruleofusca]GGP42666.1 N-acetyltransferase [Saccharothrix coeruleofusca]